jgi:beta-galactosidase
VDEIQTIEIKDLTEKELSEYKTPQTIGEGVANSGAPAFKNRNYGKLAAAYEYNGSFELPANISYSSITFFYKSIGKEQSIFVNGKEVAKDIKENEKGHDFVLDESILKPGKNTLTIIATPIPKKNDWDNVNTNPGIIQIITKNDKWKRKLFNGYAQVIIQSTGKGGEIILTAEGTGLKPGSLKVKAEEVH